MTSPTAEGHAVPGWFGKLPSLGDFASRRLPGAFVHGWDEWLQDGLVSARDAMGEGWLGRQDTGGRRFWLGPGVLCESSWTGLILPSADRVGRMFPLTIAAPLAARSRSLAIALSAHGWFDAIDAVARRVRDAGLPVKDLEHDLAQLAATLPMSTEDEVAGQLAATLLRPFERAANAGGDIDVAPCSVWWCDDASDEAEFLCVAALPSAAAFAMLFSGGPPHSMSAAPEE
jgi:type VI secretion system protein ImpM